MSTFYCLSKSDKIVLEPIWIPNILEVINFTQCKATDKTIVSAKKQTDLRKGNYCLSTSQRATFPEGKLKCSIYSSLFTCVFEGNIVKKETNVGLTVLWFFLWD